MEIAKSHVLDQDTTQLILSINAELRNTLNSMFDPSEKEDNDVGYERTHSFPALTPMITVIALRISLCHQESMP